MPNLSIIFGYPMYAGDIEKQELQIEPIDMMNRDKMNKLPEMQIDFIDSICTPIYTAFAILFPNELNHLLEGCLSNRAVWEKFAKSARQPDSIHIPLNRQEKDLARGIETFKHTTLPIPNDANPTYLQSISHQNKRHNMHTGLLKFVSKSLCSFDVDVENIIQSDPISVEDAQTNKQIRSDSTNHRRSI